MLEEAQQVAWRWNGGFDVAGEGSVFRRRVDPVTGRQMDADNKRLTDARRG
jgi:hypothetical protein